MCPLGCLGMRSRRQGRRPPSFLRRYKTLLSERMVVPLRSGLIIIPYDASVPSSTFTTRECPA